MPLIGLSLPKGEEISSQTAFAAAFYRQIRESPMRKTSTGQLVFALLFSTLLALEADAQGASGAPASVPPASSSAR